MKSKIVFLCVLVTIAFTSFAFSVDSQNNKLSFLTMTGIEALSAKETRCLVSSTSKDNTGFCKKAVNNTGDVCVTPGAWDSKNCYGHE